jgi:tetratricopeptide (TPR) repeat protein
LFSKSAAVTLPLLLLLFDYFFHSKISKKDLLNKIPFFVLSIIFGIVTIIGRNEAQHIFDITKYYSFFDRLFFIAYSISFYIISVFVPFKMSAFHIYPFKQNGLLPVIFYLAPLFLLAITVFLIKVKEFKKEIIFGILFFLICMSIMIELIPVGTQIIKERYTYISCIGLYFGFFTIVFEKTKKIKQYINYGIIVLSLVFVFISYSRTQTWKDSFSLWNDVIIKEPNCAEAYYNRGCEAIIRSDYEKAMLDCNKAIALNPEYYEAYYGRGYIKYIQKDFTGAIADCDKSITLQPDYEVAYNIKGLALSRIGNINEGINNFNKAIEIDSKYFEAYSNRAFAKYLVKDFNGAIEDCEKALKLNPNYTKADKIEDLAKQELQQK